jgi:hypothetical protein
LALIIFSGTTSSFAETRDGNWWLAQGKQAKTDYAAGMIDGMSIGLAAIAKALVKQDGGTVKDLLPYLTKNLSATGDENVDLTTVAKGYLVDVKAKECVEELDRFYSLKGNRSTSVYYATCLLALQKDTMTDVQMRMLAELSRRASGKKNR